MIVLCWLGLRDLADSAGTIKHKATDQAVYQHRRNLKNKFPLIENPMLWLGSLSPQTTHISSQACAVSWSWDFPRNAGHNYAHTLLQFTCPKKNTQLWLMVRENLFSLEREWPITHEQQRLKWVMEVTLLCEETDWIILPPNRMFGY